jgi:hypothetical protein
LRGVYNRALDSLEGAADRSVVATGVTTLNDCLAFAQFNPIRTCVSLLTLGTMPYILYVMCIQTAVSSAMYGVAMDQLEGRGELGDWELAIVVSAPASVLSYCCCRHVLGLRFSMFRLTAAFQHLIHLIFKVGHVHT